MSRSALWRQEGNVRERERQAEEIFQAAVEEGRSRASALPQWGPDDNTFHLNPMLLKNIIQSSYFQKCCQKLLDWNAVIDEIYYEVKTLQPFQTTADRKTPSTAFCLLLRLFTMRVTSHQMELTLKHPDSPYIRGIGFLYLRYVGNPQDIWRWIEPYVLEEEQDELVVAPCTGGGGGTERSGSGGSSSSAMRTVTMGEFVRSLFSSRSFGGTPLPRFPIVMEREILVKLLLADKISERAKIHYKNASRMKYFQTVGSKVMALYGDDENPIQWYRAEVDRVVTRDPNSGHELKFPKFVVTFPEYGNTETVHLGELDVMDGNWRHERLGTSGDGNTQDVGHDRKDSRQYGQRRPRDLYDEVREREHRSVTAERGWARRPPTTVKSLSGSTSRDPKPVDDLPTVKKPSPVTSVPADNSKPPPRKRTAEELAAIEDKKRRLMAQYG